MRYRLAGRDGARAAGREHRPRAGADEGRDRRGREGARGLPERALARAPAGRRPLRDGARFESIVNLDALAAGTDKRRIIHKVCYIYIPDREQPLASPKPLLRGAKSNSSTASIWMTKFTF